MAKVVKFPIPTPEKFGPQRVTKPKGGGKDKNGQLNLFAGASGRVIRLHQLSEFDEALLTDDQGDTRAARVLYTRAIEQDNAAADAYCNLGIIEWREGNTTKAIDCFTRCLALDPRHFEAHYNLANLYGEVGNFALAKVHYQVSIEIEPTFPNSYFNLGLTLAMNKEFDEAINVLMKYRELAPSDDWAQADDLIQKLRMARS